MRKSNLFDSAFIDLVASALGALVILMLIFSIKKPASSELKTGKPRGFVFYSFHIPDDSSKYELFFKNDESSLSLTEKSFHIKVDELTKNPGPDTLKISKYYSAFVWGPTIKDNEKWYNIYFVTREKGEWKFGLRYYDNKYLSARRLLNENVDIKSILSKSEEVKHKLRTNNIQIDTTTNLNIGDEKSIKISIK